MSNTFVRKNSNPLGEDDRMKIYMENLGAIRYAEVDMGKFTIICGLNNSGKTYVTYAIYGFLHFWRNEYEIKIEKDVIKRLREEGLV